MSEAFYDNFDLKLDSVQVIVAAEGTPFYVGKASNTCPLVGEDWEEARKNMKSKFHVLQKMAINLKLRRSLLPNDTRLPT